MPFNIDLPDEFSKVSSDDEIDLGRKLDKGNEFLKTLPEMKDMLGSFIGEQKDYNRGHKEHNARLETHNTRLEAILEKLAINLNRYAVPAYKPY